MKLLSGDNLLRVTSLALAVVLWIVIAGGDTVERGLSVPVELRNFPSGLETTGDLVNSVNVRLRSSPGLVESLDPGQVLARIDLQGAGEGEQGGGGGDLVIKGETTGNLHPSHAIRLNE